MPSASSAAAGRALRRRAARSRCRSRPRGGRQRGSGPPTRRRSAVRSTSSGGGAAAVRAARAAARGSGPATGRPARARRAAPRRGRRCRAGRGGAVRVWCRKRGSANARAARRAGPARPGRSACRAADTWTLTTGRPAPGQRGAARRRGPRRRRRGGRSRQTPIRSRVRRREQLGGRLGGGLDDAAGLGLEARPGSAGRSRSSSAVEPAASWSSAPRAPCARPRRPRRCARPAAGWRWSRRVASSGSSVGQDPGQVDGVVQPLAGRSSPAGRPRT